MAAVTYVCGASLNPVEFLQEVWKEKCKGNIVLCDYYPSTHKQETADHVLWTIRRRGIIRFNIDQADSVFVLNVKNYISDDMRMELLYAESRNKLIKYLFSI